MLMRKTTQMFFLLLLVFAFIGVAAPTSAADVKVDVSITNWAAPGDGKMQTFLQYLDTHNHDIKAVKNQASAGAKGDAVYSYDLSLPPAVLTIPLSLRYSSDAGMTVEAPVGWSIDGIAEIRRPLSPAFTTKDKGDWNNAEWLVSGPGFSGTLAPSGQDDGRFFLHASGPTYVVATYDKSTNTWTIHHNGVTYTLEAQDGGAVTDAGTAWWRVTKMVDGSGNTVTLKYKPDGRIDYFFLGANTTTSEGALIRVDFTYAANTATQTSVRSGSLTEFKSHLTKVTVSSLALGVTTRLYAYILDYTKTDSLDLFTTLKREGATSAVSETIAKFTYSTVSTSSSPERTSADAPASLGESASGTYGEYKDTQSVTQKMLVDTNRDGLPDVLDASKVDDEGYWYVRPRSVNASARTLSWSGPYWLDAGFGYLNMATTKYAKWHEAESASYTTYQYVDVDGDGYPDLLHSHDSGEWSVCYGSSSHKYTDCTAETAPQGGDVDWTYSQGQVAVHANSATPPASAREAVFGHVDFNDDGWLDEYAPAEGKVWLHTGVRGGGWAQKPIPLKFTHRFDGLRTVKYTYTSEFVKIDTSDYCARACEKECTDAASDAVGDCEHDCGDTSYACALYCGSATDQTVCEENCEADSSISDAAVDTCISGCSSDDPYDTCMNGEGADDGCLKTCKDSAEDTLEYYISQTDVIKEFRDINGDGSLDYIDATPSSSSSSSSWQVYLGTGGGDFLDAVPWIVPTGVQYIQRTNEGHPTVEWKSTDLGIDHIEPGSPAEVCQTLLDVDGDGRLDLVLGNAAVFDASLRRVWFQNTGSSFATTSRPIPAWWPDSFTISISSSVVENDDHISTGTTTTTETMMDIDHDGMLDYVVTGATLDANHNGQVDYMTGYATPTAGIKYGAYPKPYVIIKVDNVQGGTTDIAYRSLATVSPSGDYSKVQYTPNIKTLLDTFTTTVTTVVGVGSSTQKGGTSFSYSDGYFDKGVFQGFGSRTIDETVNDAFSGKTEFTYKLDRDFSPLVTQKKLYVDANLSFGSSIKRGTTVSQKLRFQFDTGYAEKTGNTGTFYLPKTRKVTEYGEVAGSRVTVEDFTWDGAGNLLTYTNDGAGVTDDATKVVFEYQSDALPDNATFYRMSSKAVYGTDPLLATYQNVAYEKINYDGKMDSTGYLTAGLITHTETWAGWLGGGQALNAEKLTIDYTRGSYGDITKATDNATGETLSQTSGFHGTVPIIQINGLGQKLTSTINNRGLVTEIKDDNGLAIQTAYDEFGRTIKTTAVGKDGTSHLVSDIGYYRTSAPYFTMTRTYDDGVSPVITSYGIEDGLGNLAKSWAQNKDGDFTVSTQTTDVRGLVTKSNHPQKISKTFSTTAALNMPSTFNQTYSDALGTPREVVSDATAKTGSRFVYFDNPGEQIQKDEKNYLTKTTSDAHGRVIQVEQGKDATSTITAKYRYNALDQLVSFEDAKGVTYQYSLDGIGRLRKVSVGKPASKVAFADWHTYEYKGNLLTKSTDSSGAYAIQEYDAIGRQIKLTTSDSLPSSPGTLVYTWAYDGASWIGKVSKTTDPTGYTTYTYNYLGQPVRADRVYTGTAVAPKFSYDYDLQGHVISKSFPSRHKETSTYAYGFLTAQSGVTSSTTDYTLTYGYNKWGMLESAASSLGHTFTRTFTTPLWPDAYSASYGSKTYKRAYGWLNNGLLSIRTDSTALGSTLYTYGYDIEKQLTSIKTPTKTIESFAYDTAGNMTSMQDPSGVTWTYTSASMPNMIGTRKSSTGKSETYKFTDAGRLKEWYSINGTYKYYSDGNGRLRGVTLGGVWQMVLDYDADGNVVRRADNNPYTAKPYYVYEFRDWRYDDKNKITTEFYNPYVAAENGTRVWTFSEYDGHVAMNFDDAGAVKPTPTLGAYGSTISSGTAWNWQSYHGSPVHSGLYSMGQRYLIPGDGLWIAPEPMLYRGIPDEFITRPLGLAPYRYAMNSPTAFQDSSGNAPAIITKINQYINAYYQDSAMSPQQIMTSSSSFFASSRAEALAINQSLNNGLALVKVGVAIYSSPTSTPSQRDLAVTMISAGLTMANTVPGPTGNCGSLDAAFHSSLRGTAAVASPGFNHDVYSRQNLNIRSLNSNLPAATTARVIASHSTPGGTGSVYSTDGVDAHVQPYYINSTGQPQFNESQGTLDSGENGLQSTPRIIENASNITVTTPQ